MRVSVADHLLVCKRERDIEQRRVKDIERLRYQRASQDTNAHHKIITVSINITTVHPWPSNLVLCPSLSRPLRPIVPPLLRHAPHAPPIPTPSPPGMRT